jgi:PAS domain S-box-containing protein
MIHSIERRITISFTLGLVILLAIGIVSYWGITHFSNTARWVAHTHEVIAKLDLVLSQAKDLETAQRGYVITGEERFLEPYNVGMGLLPQTLQELEQLTLDNGAQQERLRRLAALLARRLDQANHTIFVRRQNGFAAAREVILADQGRLLMDDVRQLASEMKEAEFTLLQGREAATATSASMAKFVIVAGSLFAFAVVALAQFIMQNDITQRRRAEEALREQAVALRERASLLDLAHDSILVRQLDGTIMFWNRGAEEMYGWPKEEAIGQVTHDLLKTEFPQPWEKIEATLIRQGRWEGELKHRRRDGTCIIVASRWAMQYDDQGCPLSALEINNDITERIRHEEEIKGLNAALNQHARQLEAANKELEAFSYSISHDLRAPLRAMSGFARILLEDHAAVLSEDARECAQIIASNARQMGELIDDLLAFSRLNRQPLKKRTVAPADLAHTLVDEMHSQLNGRRVRIHIDEMKDCQADPALLKQVYANLVGNALKYTRERDLAMIEIGCLDEPKNSHVIYFVKDNGIGFDMRYAHKLFGVFQRLHSVEQYEGTGVGLALVQRIVHRHGGRVWAEAVPDQGATFYFTLEGDELHDGTHH